MTRRIKQVWMHAQCDSCWIKEQGVEREAVARRWTTRENCCYCGESTRSGIYRRVRPTDDGLSRCAHRGIDARLFQ